MKALEAIFTPTTDLTNLATTLSSSAQAASSLKHKQDTFKLERKDLQNNNIIITNQKQPLSSNKFHRAAIEGYVDMLCEASRRDTNLASKDCGGLTPTLLAASRGHLDALRILVGRGGDPEKTNSEGNNALHLATTRNHLNCVSFLVNFGVNLWALNNELHTAKDVAAIEQRKEILDYLDQIMAKQSALNTKQVQKLKEKAKVGAEKRIKQMRKAQLKAIKQVEKDERFLVKLSNNRRLLKAAHSISDIKLVGRPSEQLVNYTPTSIKSTEHSPASRLLINHSASVSNLSACGTGAMLLSDWASPQMASAGNRFKINQLRSQLPAKAPQSRRSQSSENSGASSASSSADDSAYSSSSISSGSGFQMSSRSSVVTVATTTTTTTSGSVKPKQQKFPSDLTIGKPEKHLHLGSSCSASSSASSASSIGLRLRAMGGVSRKVQLKRMLHSGSKQPPTSSAEVPSLAEVDMKQTIQPSNDINTSNRENDQVNLTAGSIKWPPAPTPGSGAGSHLEEPNDALNNQDEQAQQNERDQNQQELLTQCLSQLKMRHQALIQDNQVKSKPSDDELLQRQLNAASEFGIPLKPSQIKRNQINNQKRVVATDSIGSASSLAQRNSSTSLSHPHDQLHPTYPSSSNPINREPPDRVDTIKSNEETLEMFLNSNGLSDLLEVFEKEKIDLEALVLLSEEDLKSLNILLGPRRKLANAIKLRNKLTLTANLTRPMYVMVDTSL